MGRFQSAQPQFRSLGVQVLGLSVDPLADNQSFCRDLKVTFPILSDTSKEVARRYGVLSEDRGMARRVTFLVDRQGVIRYITSGLDALSAQGALKAARELQLPQGAAPAPG